MIETPRLRLRLMREHDWPLFVKLHTNERVLEWVSDTMSEAEIHAKFQQRCEENESWHKERSQWLTLVIECKETCELVGLHGFLAMWHPYQQAELGFMILPEFQGVGYAKESTAAVIDFTLIECGFHKLIATVSEGNEASFGLLTALGFVHEGTLKDNFKIAGKWIHDQKLALIANN
ncbi:MULTISPECIES: GNAT family N-acetyltransferase [Pseudoalteromonas]|uniref:GNAT family N-acetyltransferase n=1 Tax=Pseudoalteromonas amylolytica TaxID=1859457 RepID=A0A1S1MT71_9GAMM|nr:MULTISPECIES: GNAT family N-acetyltransferase [Pseudoalteromonas]MCF6434462.1 GNAT family N-acetyltransferase [Pseudoalteromonas sp. MMG022]OHU85121.1 GNAT family N-acetyltransferase [Pseudoalteromonas sp. JW3]OHU89928.1 GNAT family N-acetyltransferase [Pseudoalteromonas amylolytica]